MSTTESAGKMPDARKEAERIVDAGKLTDPGGRVIAVAAFEDLIADIQKRTLLAAAEEIRQKYQPGSMNPLNRCPRRPLTQSLPVGSSGAIELLERLAEEIGRQG